MRTRRSVDDSLDVYGVVEGKPKTFSTGCTLLDSALGGGWPYGRMLNVVGDKSTGKTLLAIEACANFLAANPKGKVVYAEAEAAFDVTYARSLGLDTKRIEFPNDSDKPEDHVATVEDLFEHLEHVCDRRSKEPLLYIVDSVDSLSDRDEIGRDIDKASYGQSKPKKLSEMFRRLIAKMRDTNVTLFMVSQVRDAIGVMFGDKQKRSGGKALDFYASQILWLHHKGQMKVVRKKVERVVGVRVRAHVKKNKLGPPFREAEFPILFGFGIEDVQASIEWLMEVDRLDSMGWTEDVAKKTLAGIDKLTSEEYSKLRAKLGRAVRREWRSIEQQFAVTRRKY